MQAQHSKLFQENMTDGQYQKVLRIANERFYEFLADSINLCQPETVFVVTDSDEDAAHVRKMVVDQGEEKSLEMTGHTIHFDGMTDQGRDRATTKYLVPKSESLSEALNQTNYKLSYVAYTL